MLTVYPACFFKEDNGYSVIFPDLDWLSTCGKDLNEALEKSIDCLASHIYTCEKMNMTIAAPSNVSDVNIKEIEAALEISSQDAFVNMISVDVKAYAKENFERSVKKTLSIPLWLNTIALEQGINFSQVLQEALYNKIKNNLR